jgi:hypothetical protein
MMKSWSRWWEEKRPRDRGKRSKIKEAKNQRNIKELKDNNPKDVAGSF